MPRKKGSSECMGAISSCSAPSFVRLVLDDTCGTGWNGISHCFNIFAKGSLRITKYPLAKKENLDFDCTHSFPAFTPNLRLNVSASATINTSRRRAAFSFTGLNCPRCTLLLFRSLHSSRTSAYNTRSRNITAPAHNNTIAIRMPSGDVMCKGEETSTKSSLRRA